MPDDTETVKIKVKCGCGVRAVGSLRAIVDALAVLRPVIQAAGIPASLPVHAWRCRDCGDQVVVTLRHLHLAS